MSAKPKVLITGASSGIGAVYADRFARRGHDLALIARDGGRLRDIAGRLEVEAGVKVDVLRADLTEPADLAAVEARLRDDEAIEVLVNNAGIAAAGEFLGHANEIRDRLIGLNVTAPTRLAAAIALRLAQAGRGAIVNIGSVIGFAPELGMALYGASKAFLLHLSQGLRRELGPKGVYVQAVLPAATRTEIWDRVGLDVNALPAVMEVDDLVDAALAGFDRREAVTIPGLPDEAQWQAYQAARVAMLPNLRQSRPAARYRG